MSAPGYICWTLMKLTNWKLTTFFSSSLPLCFEATVLLMFLSLRTNSVLCDPPSTARNPKWNNHDVLIPRFEAAVSLSPGLLPRASCLLVLWCAQEKSIWHCFFVVWCPTSTLAPWFFRALLFWYLVFLVPWFSGALVFWYLVFLVPWCSGASCQSCPPAHSAVTRVSCCRSSNYTEETATARLTAE